MQKPLKIQVAERVRFILEQKGWKQADLARESKFNKGYISLVLSADKNLTLETIERLEKALKTPIIQILGTKVR